MTQDELKLEEAAQRTCNQAQTQLSKWADEVVTEVFHAHRSRLQQGASQAERQSTMQKGLEDAINHRSKRHILELAIAECKQTELLTKEQLLHVQRQVGLALEQIPIRVPVFVPKGLSILEPTRSSVVIALFCFVGVFIANQIQSQGSLALLASLLFAMLGGFLVTQLQKKSIHTPEGKSWSHRIYQWLSVHTGQTDDWLRSPKQTAEQLLEGLVALIAVLTKQAALLELQRQEDRQEETDILQHFFHRCADGFAETYYADIKRDPERALDACIKLISDFQEAGVEIHAIERNAPFQPEWEAQFHLSGQLQEGDPTLMIYPAWSWRGRLLSKGTLKRARK